MRRPPERPPCSVGHDPADQDRSTPSPLEPDDRPDVADGGAAQRLGDPRPEPAFDDRTGAVPGDGPDDRLPVVDDVALDDDLFHGLFELPDEHRASELLSDDPSATPCVETAGGPDGPRLVDAIEPDVELAVVVPASDVTVVGGAARPEPAAAVPATPVGTVWRAQVWARVRTSAPSLTHREVAAALAAGQLGYARALADDRESVREYAPMWAITAAEQAAERIVGVHRCRPDPGRTPGRASWARAGLVIPVLGAGHGVGASVAAAALFDALDAAGVPTLLVDAGEPARSGLLRATATCAAARARHPHREIGVAFGRRGGGWVASLSTSASALLSDAMVPDPAWWLPRRTAPAVTVVDVGWDPWEIADTPLSGPGAWLEAGEPSPRPLVVTTATRPGLLKAAAMLERLRPWCRRGLVAPPAGLVVTGARRWPAELLGSASRRVGPLARDAVLLPTVGAVAVGGIGPRAMPRRLRGPMTALLVRWGLLAPSRGLAGVLGR